MLEHPLQRFFHSMRAKRPFDWVRFQRRDLLLIDHPLCQAVFSRQGAQLLHFQPQGERPLLWCSAQWPSLAPIRGGVVICWPWFDAHPQDAQAPRHGWARLREWQLLDAYADETKVVLSWRLDLEDWHLRLDVRLGRTLELELCSHHEDEGDCLFSFALQPYWRVGALSRIALQGIGLPDGAPLGGGHPLATPWRPGGASKQVIHQPGSLLLEDSGWQRRLRIDKSLSASTLIWHPGSRALDQLEPGDAERFLCVGAANYRPGGLCVAPGERVRLSLRAALL
ncbi:D-hexose-6-phosphate mutarotase [Pseudomonas alcaligenes]|uniref:aldose epimerase family protein n=1 Tax=Pseudomonas sp. RIT-PI-AD TaxID=3035294 RepID=UPI0021DA4C16